MHKPLDSVIAVARFSFSEDELQHAKSLLASIDDWQFWLDQIELHGLSGFANKHVVEQGFVVPRDVRMTLKALVIRHKSAAQARYQTLKEISGVFSHHGIPYVALKGAALMPYLYGEESLRPMRDMDLLLPKSVENLAADCLRDIGFDLPKTQPSRFMRDMHQLPNATKKVNGFLSSVELHRDGISREVSGHFYYPELAGDIQTITWNALTFNALEDIKMIHQVSRHLEGLHSGAVLKLVNVMDVIGLAVMINEKGKWGRLQAEYPHVINTLRCLHLLTPLPASLQDKLSPLPCGHRAGTGQIMGSMRNALMGQKTLGERLRLLFTPSDWWLYLYYNIDPDKSLWLIKVIRHPLRVANWLSRRLYSCLSGG